VVNSRVQRVLLVAGARQYIRVAALIEVAVKAKEGALGRRGGRGLQGVWLGGWRMVCGACLSYSHCSWTLCRAMILAERSLWPNRKGGLSARQHRMWRRGSTADLAPASSHRRITNTSSVAPRVCHWCPLCGKRTFPLNRRWNWNRGRSCGTNPNRDMETVWDPLLPLWLDRLQTPSCIAWLTTMAPMCRLQAAFASSIMKARANTEIYLRLWVTHVG
jgi:hypothetical protein